MFCNISPASYNCAETMCTLNFAARCRSVELGQAKKGSEGAEVAKVMFAIRSASTMVPFRKLFE